MERPSEPAREETLGLRDRVTLALEELIVTGKIGPGERLDERMLAERFNVSRTPVREALNRLASTGLVTNGERQGAYVATITVAELFQTFEVMAELEGLSAKLAASRMTAEERDELRSLTDQFQLGETIPDIDKYMQINEKFHKMIYRGAHNPILEELSNQLYRRIARYRRQSLLANGRIRASSDEHRAIADAICRGDSQKAYDAMQYHVDIRRLDHADFVSFITKLNQQAQ